MAGSDAELVKYCTVASASAAVAVAEKGTEMPDPELVAEAEEEEVGDEAQAAPAEEVSKKWRVPQRQVDFIPSWDVTPNLDRIDQLPFSEERKEVYRAAGLQGVAARNQLRRIMRETQRWVRDLLEQHGEVVIDEQHKLDSYLARSKSSSSS